MITEKIKWPDKVKVSLQRIKNIPPLYIALFFFIFSFLWMFSLTYNFPFFWEDSFYIDLHAMIQKNPEAYSFQKMTALFFKILSDPQQFSTLCYNSQPCRPLLYSFFYPAEAAAYGTEVLFYRIERALFFAFFIASLFFFFNQLKYASMPLLIPFLATFSIIVIPENWVLVLYSTDPLIHILFLMVIAFLLYFYIYDKTQNKILLSFSFFVIVLLTLISTSLSHIGRIHFVIFFLFLLFTNPKKLLTVRHASLLITLFFFSAPLLSLFNDNTNTNPVPVFQEDISDIPYKMLLFFIQLPFSFFNHAFFLFLLFIIFLFLHIFSIYTKRSWDDTPMTVMLYTITVFSFFWFLLSAFLIYLSRGFTHPPLFFLRYQFSLFIGPQTLFVISYCCFVYKKYFYDKKKMQYLIIAFILLGIFSNIFLLNHWRGGWGAYILGYDTVREYIDENAKNALLVLPFDHASPLYFTEHSTNQHVMLADFTNTSLLSSYEQNYSAIYIANRDPLVFDSPTVVSLANLSIIDNSPYKKIKEIFGKGYEAPMYIYKVEE